MIHLFKSKIAAHIITRTFHFTSRSKFINCAVQKQFYQYEPKRLVQSSSPNYQLPKTPDLIYMPHVIRWMKSKLRFKYLKKRWDPEFSEGAFIYGTQQAVCRITEIISRGSPEDLEGLMTLSARIRVQDEMTHRLTQHQKDLIMLRPDDIKIFVPVNVELIKEGLKRICKVALRVLALKWHEHTTDHFKLVLVALQCEFTRDYGEKATEEWTISNFSVLECTLLSEATVTR